MPSSVICSSVIRRTSCQLFTSYICSKIESLTGVVPLTDVFFIADACGAKLGQTVRAASAKRRPRASTPGTPHESTSATSRFRLRLLSARMRFLTTNSAFEVLRCIPSGEIAEGVKVNLDCFPSLRQGLLSTLLRAFEAECVRWSDRPREPTLWGTRFAQYAQGSASHDRVLRPLRRADVFCRLCENSSSEG